MACLSEKHIFKLVWPNWLGCGEDTGFRVAPHPTKEGKVGRALDGARLASCFGTSSCLARAKAWGGASLPQYESDGAKILAVCRSI